MQLQQAATRQAIFYLAPNNHLGYMDYVTNVYSPNKLTTLLKLNFKLEVEVSGGRTQAGRPEMKALHVREVSVGPVSIFWFEMFCRCGV